MKNPLRFNQLLLPFHCSFAPFFLFINNQLILIALIGGVGFLVYYFLDREKDLKKTLQNKNDEIASLKQELESANQQLQEKNTSLDLLNKKLVSEISERENAEKFSFARDRFVVSVSNKMRSPLNTISNLTHFLLENSPMENQAEPLRNLQFAANDLVVFINDILNYSKIEAGKLNLSERAFSPSKCLGDLAHRFEQKAKEKGLLFHFEMSENIPARLVGDQARLIQISTNLISNLMSQTDEGMVDVHISVVNPKWSTVMFKILVSGTDKGKSLQSLEVLQNPIQDDTELQGYESQQLSMAIAKRLIELQNGTLEVESRASMGTSFIVNLPFKNADNDKPNSNQNRLDNYSDLRGNRVLIVEDNKVNQLVVANLLRKLGMEVTTADNGLLALDEFDKNDFDLVLMDVQMPEMDGYRATAEMRRHPDQNKSDVPIIALTSSAFLTAKEKAKLFGMNDHVGKPFSPEELLERISSCLAYCKG